MYIAMERNLNTQLILLRSGRISSIAHAFFDQSIYQRKYLFTAIKSLDNASHFTNSQEPSFICVKLT